MLGLKRITVLTLLYRADNSGFCETMVKRSSWARNTEKGLVRRSRHLKLLYIQFSNDITHFLWINNIVFYSSHVCTSVSTCLLFFFLTININFTLNLPKLMLLHCLCCNTHKQWDRIVGDFFFFFNRTFINTQLFGEHFIFYHVFLWPLGFTISIPKNTSHFFFLSFLKYYYVNIL